MPRKPLTTLLLLFSFLITTSLAAQTTGRIRGQVNDADGTVLPGVSVTVSSEALLGGSRFSTTSANGTYSFTALPPGDYQVRAELDSYQSQMTDNVRVNINTVTTVNFAMPAAFSDEVIVTDEAPLLRLSNPSSGSTYNSDFIEDLPLTRYYWDMMAVSPGVSLTFEDNTNALIAFGSGASNHAWLIDGINSNGPRLGVGFWYVNPDTIEEVQVMAVGAGAEFGDMTGAAFNVVTKSGSNKTEGKLSYYFQDDSLTDSNITLEDNPFPEFTRVDFTDATFTIGGPIREDKLWYFVAGQYFRDSAVEPGIDPAFAPKDAYDRYDAKFNFRLNDRSTLDFKLHFEEWTESTQANSLTEPSARINFTGDNPAAALNFSTVLNDRSFLEAKVSWWWGDTNFVSQTGSTEPATFDFVTGVTSGGILYPGVEELENTEVKVAVSHFAENLLGGDHDFKFGINYSDGEAWSEFAPGPEGFYYVTYFSYLYKYFRTPYQYGGEVKNLNAYVDDAWQVNDKLTVNLGLRIDDIQTEVPAYPRLDVNFQETGEIIPGTPGIEATVFSPRIGFAYNPNPKTVIRGTAGIYHDKLITANWDFPPPDLPPFEVFLRNPTTGVFEQTFAFNNPFAVTDTDAKPIRSYQYSLGFERQFKPNMSYGLLAVYKDTDRMVGWEILDDGVYQPFDWTNPLTGEVETLLEVIQAPTVRRGNGPGFTVLGEDTSYYQEYEGIVASFNRRHADGWSMRASYTLSESRGLIPNYHSNFQNNGLFTTRRGTNPNDWLNADQLLQGDRTHMFRVQANFDLPWNLDLTTSINIQSGRAHSRQANIRLPGSGNRRLTLIPADDLRFPSQRVVDMAIGRIFDFGERSIRLDLQVFNVFNEDTVDRWQNLFPPLTSDFIPRTWLSPRRVMVRFAFEF